MKKSELIDTLTAIINAIDEKEEASAENIISAIADSNLDFAGVKMIMEQLKNQYEDAYREIVETENRNTAYESVTAMIESNDFVDSDVSALIDCIRENYTDTYDDNINDHLQSFVNSGSVCEAIENGNLDNISDILDCIRENEDYVFFDWLSDNDLVYEDDITSDWLNDHCSTSKLKEIVTDIIEYNM